MRARFRGGGGVSPEASCPPDHGTSAGGHSVLHVRSAVRSLACAGFQTRAAVDMGIGLYLQAELLPNS
jgi:hypothetical protein